MTDSELKGCDDPALQLTRLRAIMRRLRGPGGCAWDAEQTHHTLLSNLIEECYEVVDAVEEGDPSHLREELGDVLLQVVFHAEIGDEAGSFNFDSIAQEICEKLIRRHPHVFEKAAVMNSEGVLTQWDEIKRKERGESSQLPYLHRVGVGLPALLAAQKLQKKAAKVGFDWPDSEGALEKVEEEITEVQEALESTDSEQIEEELGDLLFSVVNLVRKCGADSEQLLHRANQKFARRFTQMEALLQKEGLTLNGTDLAAQEAAWQEAKQSEKAL